MKVNPGGTVTTVSDGLERPTSFQFIKSTAYVVTHTVEVWEINGGVGEPTIGATR